MAGTTLPIPGKKSPGVAVFMCSQKSQSVSEVKLPVREEAGQDVTKTTGITAGLQRMTDTDTALPCAGLWGWSWMGKDSCTALQSGIYPCDCILCTKIGKILVRQRDWAVFPQQLFIPHL